MPEARMYRLSLRMSTTTTQGMVVAACVGLLIRPVYPARLPHTSSHIIGVAVVVVVLVVLVVLVDVVVVVVDGGIAAQTCAV